MEDEEREVSDIRLLRILMMSAAWSVFLVGFATIMYRVLKYRRDRDKDFKKKNDELRKV